MQVAFRQEAGESAPIQGCQDLGILLTYTWIGILYNYDRSYRIGEFFFVLNGHSRNAKNCITDVSVSDTRPHPCLPRSNSISIAPGGRPPPPAAAMSPVPHPDRTSCVHAPGARTWQPPSSPLARMSRCRSSGSRTRHSRTPSARTSRHPSSTAPSRMNARHIPTAVPRWHGI